MIVFLDFDGVVHPEGLASHDDLFVRLPLIEEVLREFPAVEIVISSSWRLEYDNPKQALTGLQQHFSADIAKRVVGVTPNHREMDDKSSPDGLSRFERHWECEAWMRTHRLPGTRWMAMDDRQDIFRPFSAHLMTFDKRVGFTESDLDPFRAYLNALTRDTPWPSYC